MFHNFLIWKIFINWVLWTQLLLNYFFVLLEILGKVVLEHFLFFRIFFLVWSLNLFLVFYNLILIFLNLWTFLLTFWNISFTTFIIFRRTFSPFLHFSSLLIAFILFLAFIKSLFLRARSYIMLSAVRKWLVSCNWSLSRHFINIWGGCWFWRTLDFIVCRFRSPWIWVFSD